MLALACNSTLGLATDAPTVYPTPQQVNFSGQRVTPGKIEEAKTAVAEKLLKDVPNKSGAYRLIIKPDSVTIAARDQRGAFYARQTLRQLKDKDGTLPVGDISDWPDIAYRGTVEGFYGQPWSHEARLSQLKFYGANKMNTYIYGPKDDPYHSSPHWREPYPADQAEHIKELVQEAHKNHVDFVWAIHPGKDIQWTDDDMNNVIKKFQMMYDLGVRSFAVFFDDIGGEGTRPEKQALLLNKINSEFIKQKPDVTDLVMCPTQYNKAWSGGDYLDILGTQLDPSIHIMWTGDTVVHDITLEGQNWVNNRVKRPTYVWWNFPVTDFVRDHLCLGRVYGLSQEPGAAGSMSGFVSNPMDKPEASKITLFGVADYSWNINGFKSEPSWKAGIKQLFPNCTNAMQTFANHNSDHGPNGHGYRREESVEIAPTVDKVLEAVRNKQALPAQEKKALADEFSKIKAAPSTIRAKAGNPRLIEEIDPWLTSFQKLGEAGVAAIKAYDRSLDSSKKATSQGIKALVDATADFATIDVVGKEKNNNPYQPGIKVGSKVLEPAIQKLIESADQRFMATLIGKDALIPTPIHQGGNQDNIDKICDGDNQTSWHSGAQQKAGDWFGLDFGSPIRLRRVSLEMGRNPDDKDFPDHGQLEVSKDLKEWTPLGEETSGMQVQWKGAKPVLARAIRYRLTSDKANWLAVREFSVNKTLQAHAISTVKGQKNLSVQRKEELVGITRVMEVSPMKKGDSITMELPDAVDSTWLEINLGNDSIDQWGEVWLTTKDSPTPIRQKVNKEGLNLIARSGELPKGIKTVRFVNNGDSTQDICINMFKLDIPAADPSKRIDSLTDGSLKTYYSCDKPINIEIPNLDKPNATKLIIVGNAQCSIQAQTSKGWSTIGKHGEKGVMGSYRLQPGTTAIRLTADASQFGKVLNEVIFR